MSSNRALLVRVARKIEPLLDRLVFVGGAVVELYFTDPAAGRARTTTDTDAICEVATYTEYQRLGDRLRELSFTQSLREADPPYRWRSGEDVFDLMPRDEDVLGFTNPWYDSALAENRAVEIDRALTIRIPDPPVYLATKLAAYEGRGRDDPLVSADLEDVVTLIANRGELVEEVEAAEPELRRWVSERIGSALPADQTVELVAGFLHEERRVAGLVSVVSDRVARLREMARDQG